jgi:hypothetical protein
VKLTVSVNLRTDQPSLANDHGQNYPSLAANGTPGAERCFAANIAPLILNVQTAAHPCSPDKYWSRRNCLTNGVRI